jgi:ABC-type antimicrobial peptide transport system permease subunit
MKKTLLTVLGIAVGCGLLIAATQRVETNRHYEFGNFLTLSNIANVVKFSLPQEMKACVVTVISPAADTNEIVFARSPLETQYKGLYNGQTVTVDLWYAVGPGASAGAASTNTMFVPDIKQGIIVKGATESEANCEFRVLVDAITLQ